MCLIVIMMQVQGASVVQNRNLTGLSRIPRQPKKPSCCSKCCRCFARVIDARMFLGPFMALIDMATDILAIFLLFTTETNVPDIFPWIMSGIVFLSLRSQALWILIMSIDEQTSDTPFFGGKYRPWHVLLGYIPIFGMFLLWSCNPSGAENAKDSCSSLARRAAILILFDMLFLSSVGIMFGILVWVPLAMYTWALWIRYLCCCGGGFCGDSRPARNELRTTSVSGEKVTSMTGEGMRMFLSLYEGLLEALPQSIVGVYIYYNYMYEGENFQDFADSFLSGTQHWQIGGSILVSCFKVISGIIFLYRHCGHEGTSKEQEPNPGMVHQRPTPHFDNQNGVQLATASSPASIP